MRGSKARRIRRQHGVRHVRLARIPREKEPSSPLKKPTKIRLTTPWDRYKFRFGR